MCARFCNLLELIIEERWSMENLSFAEVQPTNLHYLQLKYLAKFSALE